MRASSDILYAMQPAPGDTATLLHPKYQVSSCEAPQSNGASHAQPTSRLEQAVAAAKAFNQVEAAASGFSGKSNDSAEGEDSHACAHHLLKQKALQLSGYLRLLKDFCHGSTATQWLAPNTV